MRQRIRLIGLLAIFWITFFVVSRILFLMYNHDLTTTLTVGEIFLVFGHGLRMDASIGGYLLMLTGLLLTISVFTESRWIGLAINAVTIFCLLMCSIIVMADLELYRHWGFRMDTTPLFYLRNTRSEALGSVEITTVIKLLFVLATLFTLFLFLYSRWLKPHVEKLKRSDKKAAFVLFVAAGLMFVPIRGSLGTAPMNTGFVYFHPVKTFANHAAINVIWNFFYSIQATEDAKYPNDFFDTEAATEYMSSLYPDDDSTVQVFNQSKPNIILVILESFTASVIEPLGGVPGICPNLNQLCKEGVLFTNFFSSGDRTDKGLVSILSGYPSQPRSTIVRFPGKTQKLPYLPRSLKSMGYHTSFIYGGDIHFANFNSYLTLAEFQHITSFDDFSDGNYVSKWGVHDHVMLERAFSEIDSARSPFFKVILTLSSHEPFDVPMPQLIKGNQQHELFLNACHYTDKSVGAFIEKAKQTDWWKDTIVIFVADHGHRHPNKKKLEDKERFRIPLLMVGGAIKKDTVISKFSNHTDLANTVLAQIGASHKEFTFGKNILSPYSKSFSFYFFNNGYGYVAPGQYVVHDNNGNRFIKQEGLSGSELEITKSYQHLLYLDYNSK